MREIIQKINGWMEEEKQIALATVIATWGSSPQPVGAEMAITAGGEMAGSVSGGCVEGAVVEAAQEVLQKGRARLLEFGVADEDAWEVGLACGGEIQVFVRPLTLEIVDILMGLFSRGGEVTSVVCIQGPGHRMGKEMILDGEGTVVWSNFSDAGLEKKLQKKGVKFLADDQSGKTEINLSGTEGQRAEFFIKVDNRPLTLVSVGGVHIAVPLMSLASSLGFRTVVVDPRRLFGSQARFPEVDDLHQCWPQDVFPEIGLNSRTAVALLTHDPKIDDPALKAALQSDVFYIGALGSTTTQSRRKQRMLDQGLTENELARIHGPIGLDLGGRSAEEIALSILAEIIAEWNKI